MSSNIFVDLGPRVGSRVMRRWQHRRLAPLWFRGRADLPAARDADGNQIQAAQTLGIARSSL